MCPANDYRVPPMANEVEGPDNATGYFNVEAPAPCPWVASGGTSWVWFNDLGPELGNGSVQFSTTNNTSVEPRVAALTVAGYSVLVTQTGAIHSERPCEPLGVVGPIGFASGASQQTVSFLAHIRGSDLTPCSWMATVSRPWLRLVGPTSGHGEGELTLTVDPNPGNDERSAFLYINNVEITVHQAGEACGITVDPEAHSVDADAQTVYTTVTAPNGCGWELVNLSPDMLSFNVGSNPGGTLDVPITVAENTSTAARTGEIRVQRGNTQWALITIAQSGVIFSDPPPNPDPLGEPTDTKLRYYHVDAIGSVRLITKEDGTEEARYDYLPNGQQWSGVSDAVWNRVRFGGKERDVETAGGAFDALDYFGARYYQSQTGRFTAVDPVVGSDASRLDPQRWNRYVFVRNNPFRFSDPDGREVVTLMVAGAVARTAAGGLLAAVAHVSVQSAAHKAGLADAPTLKSTARAFIGGALVGAGVGAVAGPIAAVGGRVAGVAGWALTAASSAAAGVLMPDKQTSGNNAVIDAGAATVATAAGDTSEAAAKGPLAQFGVSSTVSAFVGEVLTTSAKIALEPPPPVQLPRIPKSPDNPYRVNEP